MSEYQFDLMVGHKIAKIFKLVAVRCNVSHYDIKCEHALFPLVMQYDNTTNKTVYVSALHMTMFNEGDTLAYVLSWHHYIGGRDNGTEHKFRLSKHPECKGIYYGNIQYEHRLGMVYEVKDLAKLTSQIVW